MNNRDGSLVRTMPAWIMEHMFSNVKIPFYRIFQKNHERLLLQAFASMKNIRSSSAQLHFSLG